MVSESKDKIKMENNNKQNEHIGIDMETKPKLTIVHRNTEMIDVPLDNENDKIAWIVLHNKEGKRIIFYPQKHKEEV